MAENAQNLSVVSHDGDHRNVLTPDQLKCIPDAVIFGQHADIVLHNVTNAR